MLVLFEISTPPTEGALQPIIASVLPNYNDLVDLLMVFRFNNIQSIQSFQ